MKQKKDKRKRNSIGDKYNRSKASAKWRNIPFLLTFEEWLNIWITSGHLGEWGRGSLNYCMSRPGDKGAYEVGNIRIITNKENLAERNRLNPGFGHFVSEAARIKMRKRARKRKATLIARKNMSLAGKKRWARERAAKQLISPAPVQ